MAFITERVHRKVGSQPASQPLPAASETAPLQIEDRAAAGKHRCCLDHFRRARGAKTRNPSTPFYLDLCSLCVPPSTHTQSHTYDDYLFVPIVPGASTCF